MVDKSKRHVLKRIDTDLAKQIQELADKNDMSFREASREFARLRKLVLSDKKIYRELKI